MNKGLKPSFPAAGIEPVISWNYPLMNKGLKLPAMAAAIWAMVFMLELPPDE